MRLLERGDRSLSERGAVGSWRHATGELRMNRSELHKIDELDWAVRTFVYAFIAEHGHPPAIHEVSTGITLSHDRTVLAFRRLNHRHALFLEPGTLSIRMAHPFSGVSTPFRVHANGRAYWANCAWDMLGIPAALHTDAEIEAHCSDAPDTTVTLRIAGGIVSGHGEVVHFPLPFRQWYDDLVFT